MTVHAAFIFLLLPNLASASCYARIVGVCNQYKGKVTVINMDHREETCSADAEKACAMPSQKDGSNVPKITEAHEHVEHHIHVMSEDGKVKGSLWHDSVKNVVKGGTDFGNGKQLAQTCGKNHQFNVVVAPNGGLSLWMASSHKSCPKIPKLNKCLKINSRKGSWVAVSSSSVTAVTDIFKGMDHSYAQTDQDQWSWSVLESFNAGFDLGFGNELSFSVSSTQSGAVAKAKTNSFTYVGGPGRAIMGPFKPGQVWQWQWAVEDECGSTVVMDIDVVRTNGKFEPPCCLPGYFKDPYKAHGECVAGVDGKVYDMCRGGAF